MLKIENLVKRYGHKEVLKGFNYTFCKGVYGMLGANVPRYEQETGSLFRHLQLWRELYT